MFPSSGPLPWWSPRTSQLLPFLSLITWFFSPRICIRSLLIKNGFSTDPSFLSKSSTEQVNKIIINFYNETFLIYYRQSKCWIIEDYMLLVCYEESPHQYCNSVSTCKYRTGWNSTVYVCRCTKNDIVLFVENLDTNCPSTLWHLDIPSM